MSDPCQCLFDHEAAMRRLISWLRESQDYAQDTPGLPDAPQGSSTMMMWTMMWGVIALALFFLRPTSLRQTPDQSLDKPGPGGPVILRYSGKVRGDSRLERFNEIYYSISTKAHFAKM